VSPHRQVNAANSADAQWGTLFRAGEGERSRAQQAMPVRLFDEVTKMPTGKIATVIASKLGQGWRGTYNAQVPIRDKDQ
jgi:hypothetical protein